MRAVVIDALSGRQVPAGPEEVEATQPLVAYLVQRLGWKPTQMMTRPQWRVPKTPSGSRNGGYPIDLAIFEDAAGLGNEDKVRILAECKAPDVETGVSQLKIYLGLEPEARLGIWFNGTKHAIVYKLPGRFVVDYYAAIPRPSDPLVPSENEPPLRFENLKPPLNIGEVFSRLRDRIAAQDSKVNRDEFILNDLANLLICKIADEQQSELDPQRHLAFQRAGDAAATGHAIRQFFVDVKRYYPAIFTDESDRLHIDDNSLHEVVRTLEKTRLLGFDRHAVGTAFQILRGRALKGEEGAYFTPPPLVDAIVQVLAPDHTTRLIDPASGTGGFLAATLDYVFESIDARENVSQDAKTRVKRDWAASSIYAVDKDVVSTKLCKAYLTLLGDGRAHVYRANAIDRGDWSGRDELKRDVSAGRFDMVMSNPPFGQNLTVHPDVGRREGLITCRRWREVGDRWEPTEAVIEQQLGIAFFERNMDLLRPGGRMAIVLPETFLFSKSFRWFVDWISRSFTITHVIDVPMVAFEEFCRAKTCILFVRKEAPPPGHRIAMSFPRSIGQDKRGKTVYALNGEGRRVGELDNEMADAAALLVGSEYRGQARTARSAREETRLLFHVSQDEVRRRGIMVPRFWWRQDTEAGLRAWSTEFPSAVTTLGALVDAGIVEVFEGHGSPPGNARATGDVPYVKVTDLKNWRINENPTNFVHHAVADRLRRNGVVLHYGDLITPARASSNIGQFSLVLPWQTNILLTKEVLILRVVEDEEVGLTPFLLLALLSLKVVQDQYKTLALMQTNREHLGDHWREVQVPFPSNPKTRDKIGGSVKAYFDGIVKARVSWEELRSEIDLSYFGTRP